ncbi:CbiQ family ECF transporter T component [Zoogloea sp.]|uniref:CbiQ family ECF transporter T component n=1 Tax=Zoogloea sp. TaxID=49181 RepID=UPI0031FE0AC8
MIHPDWSGARFRFHPASLLIAWVGLVLAVQLLRGAGLMWLGLLIAPVAFGCMPQRARRLLRRVRYLLVVLLVLFAWFTPGELAFSGVSISPTREGLALAAVHGGRLVLVVLLAAILLEGLDASSLASGIDFLCRPLRWTGGSPERLIIRFLLVFQYVENPPPGGWRALLKDPAVPLDEPFLAVRSLPWHWRDWMLSCLAMAGLMMCSWESW